MRYCSNAGPQPVRLTAEQALRKRSWLSLLEWFKGHLLKAIVSAALALRCRQLGFWSMLGATVFFVAQLLAYLEDRPRPVTFMLSLVLVGCLGLLDYYTGPDLSVSIFYLLPISLTAWLLGGRWAMVMSAVAMLSWLWADVAAGELDRPAFIPYWNALIRFGYFVIVSYLFAFIRGRLESERILSRTDPLTGAMNKLAFSEFAESELNRVRRYGHPLSLAYIDLDNFKAVNDTWGHKAGDKLLTAVVNTLKQVMRKTDLVARLGGDEFAVVMIETRPAEARRAFVKAQASLLAAMEKNNWPVTFSIGIVTFLEPPETVEELLHVADTLMYRAKRRGKNRVSYEIVPPTRSNSTLESVRA